ncbi:MAG: hypothetical protein R3A46_15095 [Thermomicrobiales bacterium]
MSEHRSDIPPGAGRWRRLTECNTLPQRVVRLVPAVVPVDDRRNPVIENRANSDPKGQRTPVEDMDLPDAQIRQLLLDVPQFGEDRPE